MLRVCKALLKSIRDFLVIGLDSFLLRTKYRTKKVSCRECDSYDRSPGIQRRLAHDEMYGAYRLLSALLSQRRSASGVWTDQTPKGLRLQSVELYTRA